MKKILFALLCLASFARADVVKPALVEISIFADKKVEVVINLSLEAAMTGIGTQYKKTTDAPNSAQYDELRALDPEILRERFTAFESQFLNSIQLSTNGKVQDLTLKSSKIDIVGYKKRPRKTILTYSAQLKDWPKTLSWQYGLKKMSTIGVSGNGYGMVSPVASLTLIIQNHSVLRNDFYNSPTLVLTMLFR